MKKLSKMLFKYRIKLLLNYVKTAILFEFDCLRVFSPIFAGLFLSKIKLPILGWVLGCQCIVMFYFNFNLLSYTNKWYDKLNSERKELRYAILEEKSLITKVGNIKILPFGKH